MKYFVCFKYIGNYIFLCSTFSANSCACGMKYVLFSEDSTPQAQEFAEGKIKITLFTMYL